MTRSGNRRVAFWSALSIGILIVGFVGVLATRESAASRQADSPLLGKIAPEIAGTDLNGRQRRLSEFRGKYVVVNFFATWCVPCQKEHPELDKFRSRHAARQDAEVLAVIFSDEVPEVRRFFRERGGEWPVLADPNGKVALDFGVRGPPESFLISPSGHVLTRIVGAVTDSGLEQLLRQSRNFQQGRNAQ